MKKRFYLSVMIISLGLAACASDDFSDLDKFIQESGEGLRGQVDPIPVVKPFEHFVYEAFEVSSPFISREKVNAKTSNSELQPDLMRRKEILEHFPLESLKMVGSLQQQNKIFALIKSPENTLHRVTVGNFVGQDFGLIATISESEIKLKEIVQDGVNEWIERTNTLMLEDEG